MTDYEQQQVNAIDEWKKEEPGVVSKTTGWVLKPLSWAVEKVVPAKALQGALNMANAAAQFLTDTGDIIRDGGVESIEELQTKDLKLSDELADHVHNWALAAAATEGGATGAAGLLGLAADIPALITMCLRAIHKIGLCYGFDCKDEALQRMVYDIMSVAGANSVQEKVLALGNIQAIKVIIAKTAWKKMAESAAANQFSRAAIVLAVKNLAKQLGINLTKRKALQAIPVVGGVIGASMNVAFVNDIAWAARRTFQELWLQRNGRIEVEVVEAQETPTTIMQN